MWDIIVILVLIAIVSTYIGYVTGKQTRKEQKAAYWEGRGDGWKACEDMVIGRVVAVTNLTKEEVLEEILQ